MQGHNQPNSLELGQAAAFSLQFSVCYVFMEITVASPSAVTGQRGREGHCLILCNIPRLLQLLRKMAESHGLALRRTDSGVRKMMLSDISGLRCAERKPEEQVKQQ